MVKKKKDLQRCENKSGKYEEGKVIHDVFQYTMTEYSEIAKESVHKRSIFSIYTV